MSEARSTTGASCSTRPSRRVPNEIDPEILRRLQRGDASALAEVWTLYGDRVYNTCRRITGSDQDAEDATQEVFVRLLDQAGNFRGESRFSTWLFRMAVNHTINLYRRERRRQRELVEGYDETSLVGNHAPAPLDSVLNREEQQHLDEALQRLPLDQRAIVILREIEGLTYAEIAAVLDLPEGTVTSRLVRGRERLAESLRHRLQA